MELAGIEPACHANSVKPSTCVAFGVLYAAALREAAAGLHSGVAMTCALLPLATCGSIPARVSRIYDGG